MAKEIKIRTDEHVLVPGMTGSGKTFLCETYLAEYQNVIKLDTKNEVEERRRAGKSAWKGLQEGKDFEIVYSFSDLVGKGEGKYIFVPPVEEQTKDDMEEFFKFCYLRENTIIWVDELMSISTARQYPDWLRAVMTRGRSKKVAVWACTQRPMDMPTIISANTTHFFVFDLALDQDRKKMRDITGYEEMLEKPGKHWFWYYNLTKDNYPVRARLKV